MVEGEIAVEVVYAKPDEQASVTLCLANGATARQAVESSGLLRRFPEIDLKVVQIGIFSKICGLDHVLHEGDRVEVYRPLLMDPKDLRRQRAAKAS